MITLRFIGRWLLWLTVCSVALLIEHVTLARSSFALAALTTAAIFLGVTRYLWFLRCEARAEYRIRRYF